MLGSAVILAQAKFFGRVLQDFRSRAFFQRCASGIGNADVAKKCRRNRHGVDKALRADTFNDTVAQTIQLSLISQGESFGKIRE